MARPVVLLALLCLALPLAACGSEEEELDVAEGEPIEAEGLSYNVVISRFLNPDDEEDSAYVEGQPPPPPNEQYFGVFLEVENKTGEAVTLPEDVSVIDTAENRYEPLESESPFALPLGEELNANEKYPIPNSIAADGPTGGSLILFLIEESSTESRPLEMELPLPSGDTGIIELDI